MPSASMRDSTDSMWMTARVSSKRLGFCQPFAPSRTIHTVTFEPGAPRRRVTASSSGMLSVDSSSILTMRSCFLRPARAAGVPGIGRITVSCPSRIEITMPRPPNSPRVLELHLRYASGVSSTECGSSVRSMPLTAAYSTSRSLMSSSCSQVLLQEPEDLLEAPGQRPRRVHVVDAELARLVVDLDLERAARRSRSARAPAAPCPGSRSGRRAASCGGRCARARRSSG